MQLLDPGSADAGSHSSGTDARQEKHLGGIDIPHSYHQASRQKQLLDGHPAFLESRLKSREQKLF